MANETKHVLSPYFSIPPIEPIVRNYRKRPSLPEEIRQLRDGESFILQSSRGTQFLINPTIKIFLESFLNPITFKEVVSTFAKEAKVEPDQIEPVMKTFFKRLVKKQILVSESNATIVSRILEDITEIKRKYQDGDLIDDYKVIEKISVRKSTQLYLCQKVGSDSNIVLKLLILPKDLPTESQEKALKKFKQEFKLMQELTPHANICNIISYNNEQNYAVLEHIEGKSIRKLVSRDEADIKKKLEIIKQVLTAIAYVQERKIIHGDIHLSNFLITEDFQVKLIDFGMSNHTALEENEVVRNGGVHECIPPERANEDGGFSFLGQKADFRSEVFQLGVIIYYMLYGKYPFYGFTWQKLANSIINDQLNYSSKTYKDEPIPTFLIELLEKAMQKDPMHRFANAGEMLLYFNENQQSQ